MQNTCRQQQDLILKCDNKAELAQQAMISKTKMMHSKRRRIRKPKQDLKKPTKKKLLNEISSVDIHLLQLET